MSETTSLADRSQDGDSEHIEFGDDGEMVEEIVRYIHNCCIVHVANGALMHTIQVTDTQLGTPRNSDTSLWGTTSIKMLNHSINDMRIVEYRSIIFMGMLSGIE